MYRPSPENAELEEFLPTFDFPRSPWPPLLIQHIVDGRPPSPEPPRPSPPPSPSHTPQFSPPPSPKLPKRKYQDEDEDADDESALLPSNFRKWRPKKPKKSARRGHDSILIIWPLCDGTFPLPFPFHLFPFSFIFISSFNYFPFYLFPFLISSFFNFYLFCKACVPANSV